MRNIFKKSLRELNIEVLDGQESWEKRLLFKLDILYSVQRLKKTSTKLRNTITCLLLNEWSHNMILPSLSKRSCQRFMWSVHTFYLRLALLSCQPVCAQEMQTDISYASKQIILRQGNLLGGKYNGDDCWSSLWWIVCGLWNCPNCLYDSISFYCFRSSRSQDI